MNDKIRHYADDKIDISLRCAALYPRGRVRARPAGGIRHRAPAVDPAHRRRLLTQSPR